MDTLTLKPRDVILNSVVTEIEGNGEEAKSAKLSMVALSGEPIDRMFGRIIFDLAGMKHRNRIAVNYSHDDQPIGYVNQFKSEEGRLTLSGAIVPNRHSSVPLGIIDNALAGVPYEASIEAFPIDMEEATGETVTVNGREFNDVDYVVRSWELSGVALCQSGADRNTEVKFEFKADADVTGIQVNVIKQTGDTDMETNEVESTEQEAQTDVETETIEAEAADSATETADVEAEKVELEADTQASEQQQEQSEQSEQTEQTEQTEQLAPGHQFMQAFGETDGALYFAKGFNMEQANAAHIEKLTQLVKQQAEQIETLQGKLDAVKQTRGLETGIELTPGATESESKRIQLCDMFAPRNARS